MQTRKIVLTGGPGTGKTSVINALQQKGFYCLPEVSREITLQARKNGVEQLFLKDPHLFSEKLLEGRKQQFLEAERSTEKQVFLDRGLPDVLAYMDYIGDSYPLYFNNYCQVYRYDIVFLLEPWEAIYNQDNERYENFSQAKEINKYLVTTYQNFNYILIALPFTTVAKRIDFILQYLEKNC